MSQEPVSYKDTLCLPKTAFPMKANLTQREPEYLAFWNDNSIYQKMQAKNQTNENFTMPDGPPYANGSIHIGHVLNKVLKDIVVKYQNLKGRHTVFIPGWDCHGLPIEQNVTKALGPKRKEKTDTEMRTLCRQEAHKWVDKQREEFKRLGILADWENPYRSMDKDYEAQEVREIAAVLENGVLFRGEKPVYWCAALQTALAEAEVEYHEHQSPSIYVRFSVKEGLDRIGSPSKPTSFVIWTTTPWSLPANLAISLHPKFDYGLYETRDEILIIAEGLKESFEEATGLNLKKIDSYKGTHFEKMLAQHPFIDRKSLLTLGEHVSLETGTGCVHTAPGHGHDDYQVGLKYGLSILSPVDAQARFTEEVPQYQGLTVFEANPKIIEDLKKSGHLVAHKEITHQYPYCWRSKTPLIYRSTPQWFIRMDDETYNIRQKALKALDDVRFVPSWGEQRLRSMIENRPDWCLSRQRIWGVPIPIFYCESCDEPLVNREVILKVADVMEEEDGIEAFYRHPASHFTGSRTCEKCNHPTFRQSQDILDVWFDSGVCHSAVQERREGMAVPASVYLEGSDQHRGWFQTSLLSSIAANGKAPYKTLLTHNFVNDAQGRKMSKSLGNVTRPQDVMKKGGAEILRLWVSAEDYGQDIKFSNESFQRVTETYRRIRNTVRFLLGNISDFDTEKDLVPYDQMMVLDQWALSRLNNLIQNVTNSYENFEYYKVYQALNHYFTVDLSAIYLDILKDRLYTWKKTGTDRRSAQTVLFKITESLLSMMAPILSFLAEESYSHFPGKKEESIFLVPFPQTHSDWNAPELEKEFEQIFEVRSEVSKILEDLRRNKDIGASLEAQVEIQRGGDTLAILKKYEKHLCEYFIVSNVILIEGEDKITASKAPGEKCARCWNYNPQTGTEKQFPEACPKCVEALS